jgi:ADP-heptose:LPS heptosyltransferase
LSLSGIDFVSLQREYREADMAALAAFRNLRRLDAALADFADTAAVVEALDLVITVDTAVAHLAGALGKPVWILVSSIQDWRWLLQREDSPWYPTARLFRQPEIGDWDSVIGRLARELAAFAHR